MAPTTDARSPVPRALALGAAAGLLAGLFGVGGGVVLVPGLVALAGLDQHRAHATSLAAILATAPAALAPFAAEGDVSWPAAGAIALGAVVGAVGGADLMRRLSADRLRQLFGALMVVVAVRLLLPGGAVGDGGAVDVGLGVAAGLVATGLATGVLSALMGVGGGIVVVPAMVVVFGFGQHVAEGTSLAVIIPTALVGAWRHARRGYTRWRLGLTVGAGGVVGGLVGGSLAQALHAEVLQAAFSVLLVVTGVRLVRRGRDAAVAPEGRAL
jgi:uncharacterized membrane protein YfcA